MKTRKYDIYTFTAAANNTIEALANAKASVAGNVSITRAKHDGVVLYCRIKFADGHKKMVTGMGKTIESAEHNLLCNIIKRIVPADEYANAVEKLLGKTDIQIDTKTDISAEAKVDIQVEAKSEVIVEKEAPAVMVTEIPRLETVRKSRSPKKLKAQKMAESTENKVVVEIGPKIEAAAETAPATLTGIPMAISKAKRKLYELVIQNTFTIGNKKFAFIPLELLFADGRFQRLNKKGGVKVRLLIERWKENKCDPLRVSPHDEECAFSIIDGFHRYLAASAKGFEGIVCEILDVPADPTERLKVEAEIFATQNDELDPLSPVEKHEAYLILEKPEYLLLEKMLKRYNIGLKVNSRGGCVKAGYLASYTDMLAIGRIHGEDMVNDIFSIICGCRWNLCNHGFAGYVTRTLRNVLMLHPDRKQEIVAKTIDYFMPISPEQFLAESMSAYPERKNTEKTTLHLEDYLCDAIGMERIYLADKGIERHSTVNAEVPVGVSAS